MYKIALLITGTTRNYIENYPTWKKYLLDIYPTDIFFHTYDVIGYQKIDNKKPIPDLENFVDLQMLLGILKPVKYKIDYLEQTLDNFRHTMQTTYTNKTVAHPEYIKAQLYSIYQANLLKTEYEKEFSFTYDIVIKIRFDTIFLSEIVEKDLNLIKANKKIIMCGNEHITKMTFKNACEMCIQNKKRVVKIIHL